MVRRLWSCCVLILIVLAPRALAQCPTNAEAAAPGAPSDANFAVGANVQFTWAPSNVSGVTYDVFAWQNINNPQLICSNQTGSSCTAVFNTAGQWSWAIKTKKNACPDVASGAKNFTIGCLSAPPVLQSPANNATNVATNVTLTWAAVSGADSYDIFIGTNACGVNGQLASSNTTSFTPPTLNAGTTYGWRVVAKKNGCPGTGSSCGTFTTAGAACNAPGSFDLRSPNNLTVGATPTLQWNGANNAAKYVVHIGTSNPPATSPNDPIITGTSYVPQPLSPGTYFWNVDAYPSCSTTISTRSTSTYTFTVRPCPTGTANITSPVDQASIPSTTAVTLNWIGVASAVSYDVMLSTDNGATFTKTGSTQAGTTSLTKSLNAGSYIWYVRTIFDVGCPSTNSQASRFTVTPSNCPTTPPTLTSPTNGATTITLPVSFNWNAVSGATGYKVFASANGTTSLLGSTADSTRFITSNVPSGTVTWWVQALFDSCPSTESAHFTFTTASNNCPTTAPVLVTPANGAANVENPVKFDWNAVSGAKNYRVFVSIDGGTSVPIGLTSETELEASVPGASIEWWTEANFDNCASVASQHFLFTTTACPQNPGTPSIVSPTDGATNLTSPVTLQWSAVAGAKAYVILASFNGSASVAIGVTTSTQLSVSLPIGTYTWVVEARFGDDCPPTVSPRASFTVTNGSLCTSNTAPTLISPQNGASNLTSPITFDWHDVSGAIAYNVYAGTDTDQSLLGTTTASTLTRSVPKGTTTWYVDALFPGCEPVRSATSHFTLATSTSCDGLTISRVSPADGATVTSPVTFQWTPVNGATIYRLWLASENGAAAIVARTTSTSASVQVPSGNGSWYVEAILANCPAILSSTGRFTVPKGANCDGHTGPTLVAPIGSLTADKVIFQWNAVSGAVAYRLWLAVNNQPFAEVGLTKDLTLTRELPAASYSWFVDALFENCPPVPSARASFVLENTTPRCSNSAPSLVSPPDKSENVSSPVTFLWSSVANAVEYRLFASLNGGTPHLVTSTPDTSFTQPLPPGTLSWSVEAVFRNCPSMQSATSSFTIVRSQNCGDTKPRLVSPADGTQNLTSPVTLSWEPLTGAIGYVVFARHGDGAPTAIGKTASETTLQHNFPDGRIEWWVLAFLAGCDPAESTHFTFSVTTTTSCDHRRPILLAPEQGERDVLSPVHFAWTAVAGATGYNVWIQQGDDQPSVVATSTVANATADVPSGITRWFVEAKFAGCPSTFSAIAGFNVLKTAPACATPDKPVARVVGQVQSGATFTVRWTPLVNVGHYELQESPATDFSNAVTFPDTDIAHVFSHVATVPTQYVYRVRGVSSCNDESGPWSDVVGVFVMPVNVDVKSAKSSTEAGEQGNVVQTIFLPAVQTPVTFSARADKPWLTVTPSSGILGSDGVTLTVTAAPGTLNLGTNTGTVLVTYGSAGKAGSNASTVTSVPISVSVVTPVSPVPRNTPQPDSLIIPGVAHANGANNSLFQSDVRLANVSAQTMKYLLNFTPIATDGTQSGNSTTIEIEPGATTALDDILSSFFGANGTLGTLEIRPVTTSTSSSSFASSVSPSTLGVNTVTVASSRTYNVDPAGGTLGQFIPAIPYSKFISKSSSSLTQILSLQQLANSTAYRTNIGLVEASGQAASVLMRVFDDKNSLLAEIPVSLKPGEYLQDNFFAKNGLTFADGRVEIQVTTTGGKVTAYASTVDNLTQDPLLVSPVIKSSVAATRYVLPGIAALNTGLANWRSDVRVYNAGTSDTTATLTYVPMPGNPPAAQPVTVTLKAGEVAAYDDILKSQFGLNTDSGGALSISTATSSSLITSARTYNLTTNGTLGQFIPGVTPNEAIGNGEGSLQLLQLEQSDRYRTNIGLAETNGQAATVEVLLYLPDSKVTPVYTVPLEANQFVQFPMSVFNAGTVYNGRVSVKVISGSGRVTAYGSIIDALTGDPTYVPQLK